MNRAATTDERMIRLLMELRQNGISDTKVLSAIEQTPREEFVLETFADQAYANRALPIDSGQTISQPYIVAYMTAALEAGERLRVLEIGTGSGYQAAVLARLFRRVYTVERYRSLLQRAEGRFKRLGLHNITTRLGDGFKGWPEQAPFDRIIVTAAAPEIPDDLLTQLADPGILVAPVGEGRQNQRLVRWKRTGNEISREELIAVRFVPLVEGIADDRT
jgi:protein-L-isoaspartate(D-aspartate) O-methyltransferase